MEYRSVFKNKSGDFINYDRPVKLKYRISSDFSVYQYLPNQFDYLYKDICFAQMAGIGTKEETEQLINNWLLGIDNLGKYHQELLNKAIEMAKDKNQ